MAATAIDQIGAKPVPLAMSTSWFTDAGRKNAKPNGPGIGRRGGRRRRGDAVLTASVEKTCQISQRVVPTALVPCGKIAAVVPCKPCLS